MHASNLGPSGGPPPTTEYVEYDSNYPIVFEQLEKLIHSVLPDTRIEHVGSTSVPGLGGRRVLDVELAQRIAQAARTQ